MCVCCELLLVQAERHQPDAATGRTTRKTGARAALPWTRTRVRGGPGGQAILGAGEPLWRGKKRKRSSVHRATSPVYKRSLTCIREIWQLAWEKGQNRRTRDHCDDDRGVILSMIPAARNCVYLMTAPVHDAVARLARQSESTLLAASSIRTCTNLSGSRTPVFLKWSYSVAMYRSAEKTVARYLPPPPLAGHCATHNPNTPARQGWRARRGASGVWSPPIS